MNSSQLVDKFQRKISYLRLSVTDRCDYRCLYCMAEEMTFLPRKDVLSLEEMLRLGRIFTELGVTKIRITGGEPLIRKDILTLLNGLGKLSALQDLCLTTNGSHLSQYANDLVAAGVNRVNISIDSLDKKRFAQLTRFGKLDDVLRGIDAALQAGFSRIKLNSVLMRNFNLDEAERLASFALERGIDISFIEEMPLGEIRSHARHAEYIRSDDLRDILSNTFSLTADSEDSGGPSRYWQVAGYDAKIAFISPHSDNFCASCNRVRVSAAGRLLLCLGNEHSVDLRSVLRDNPHDDESVKHSIIAAMDSKPERHYFDLESEPQILRFMNATGG